MSKMAGRGLVIAIGALLGGCVACTEIGCGASFGWSAPFPVGATYADIAEMTVTACRNDECRSARLDVREPDRGTGLGIEFSDPSGDALPVSATLWRSSSDAYSLEVDWHPADPADGDRYRVEVGGAGEVVLGLAEEAVTYDRASPNGPSCPPECLSASRSGSNLGGT
jgi:hypothetical protein